MDRRRLRRTHADTRLTLERALGSWLRLRISWQTILDAARAAENWERLALAEAKVEECQAEIAHIESMLARPAAPS